MLLIALLLKVDSDLNFRKGGVSCVEQQKAYKISERSN